MVDANLLIELSELFKWPIAIIVIFIAFFIIFFRPLSGLIGRITNFSKDGIQANPISANQKDTPENNEETVKQLIDRIGNNAIVTREEETIYSQLREKNLDVEGDAVKVLVRHLAGTNVLREFEQIYYLIFSSQISLLRQINQKVNRAVSVQEIEQYFENVKDFQQENLHDWSTEKFIAFLIARNLLVRSADQVFLSDTGVEFLIWLTKSGLTEKK